MRIHKAGIAVILFVILFELVILLVVKYTLANAVVDAVLVVSFFLLLLFVMRFFREPMRKISFTDGDVIAPADGKVVVIENIIDEEFTKQEMIQISIFMSVWNVHINWLPVLGNVIEAKHFSGNYMKAILPKASFENERAVITIMPNAVKTPIVVKQIAGAVARRVITYVSGGHKINAGEQLGFIRFGSRVDILLPLDYQVDVKLGDKTTGGITKIAHI